MSISFAACRGEVVSFGGAASGGAYSLQGGPSANANSPILYTGGNIGSSDVTARITTLTNQQILYVFGEAWGDASINGMVLLGKVGSNGNAAASLKTFFDSKRVSKQSSPVGYSTPAGTYNVYITGFVLTQADPVFNIQEFSFTGTVAPVKA